MSAEPHSIELPYRADSAPLFEALADRPWAAFLDTGMPGMRQGRYDILVADPVATLVTRGPLTCIDRGGEAEESREDPLALLARELTCLPHPAPGEWPFTGGAVGWFGYDLARRVESLPQRLQDEEGLPEMAVGLYTWAVIVDHAQGRTHLVGTPEREPLSDIAGRLLAPAPRERSRLTACSAVEAELTEAGYRTAFARIQHYLREGDCYQVNFAQRFSVPVTGDPWEGYLRLRQRNPAPFGGYLTTPFGQLLSCSPERFLSVRDGVVETRPIKGTVARSIDPQADRAAREWLAESTKDRAENLMIVDLLRNDLGKCCEIGSVSVPGLFELESFATVHHLVSTVRGLLAAGVGPLDLLRACFPGGSITGAPKRRAMEIIEELEGSRRGVYCGAIGYVGRDGAMDTNIAIRTVTVRNGRARFWAGGGIVHDSTCESEYNESLAKAQALLDFFAG